MRKRPVIEVPRQLNFAVRTWRETAAILTERGEPTSWMEVRDVERLALLKLWFLLRGWL